MHKLNFGKTLTDEEYLLLQKYKVLRAKREQYRKQGMIAAVSKTSPVHVPTNRNSETSEEDAKEKAKKLLLSGKITISPQDKKSGFKKAKILERKLSEGQRSVDPTLPPPPRHVQDKSERSSIPFTGEELTESSKKSQETKDFYRASSSSCSRSQSLNTSLSSFSCSTAATEWTSSIQDERLRRNRKSDYFDYKRRVIVYSSDSSDDE